MLDLTTSHDGPTVPVPTSPMHFSLKRSSTFRDSPVQRSFQKFLGKEHELFPLGSSWSGVGLGHLIDHTGSQEDDRVKEVKLEAGS